MTTVVSILGMHRSGTSCLTGCLQECGLHLGDVVTENWDNPKGNRENLELRRINDAVLRFSGGSWKRPPDRLSWNTDLRQIRDEAIASRATFDTWGFKDPRTLLTLPFWLEALPDMKFVGTFRHASAVISSLFNRDKIPEAKGQRIWRHYNTKLLDYVEEYRFPLICFDWSRDRYEHEVIRAARHLGLSVDFTGKELGFFDASLIKHTGHPSDRPVSEECEDLYRRLLVHSGDESAEVSSPTSSP